MTAAYIPAEVERLIALCRTANPSNWRLAMADQLEAARDEIAISNTERDAARTEADQLQARVAADSTRIDALVQDVRLAQYERDRAQRRVERIDQAPDVETIGPSRPTHLVVIAREEHVTATPFYDAASALAFANDAGAQRSETYVAKIIKWPLV